MEDLSSQLVYPLTKEDAGPSFWKVLHSYAAEYPTDPSKADRYNAIAWLKETVRHFPCDNCRSDAMHYLHEHPPQTGNKYEFFDYLCGFHNSVNEKLGKPKHDCNTMLMKLKPRCDSCSTSPGEGEPANTETGDKDDSIRGNNPAEVAEVQSEVSVQRQAARSTLLPPDTVVPTLPVVSSQPPLEASDVGVITSRTEDTTDNNYPSQHQDVQQGNNPDPQTDSDKFVLHQHRDVKSSLTSYKRVSTKVLQELCDHYKVPMPQVVFAPCPKATDTSCTWVMENTVKQELVGKPVIFLHPGQSSARTIAHEFFHYYHMLKGNRQQAFDEYAVDKEAMEIVMKEFPADDPEPALKKSMAEISMKDVLKLHDLQTIDVAPKSSSSEWSYTPPPFSRRRENIVTKYEWHRDESWKERFPMHQKRLKDAYGPPPAAATGPTAQPAQVPVNAGGTPYQPGAGSYYQPPPGLGPQPAPVDPRPTAAQDGLLTGLDGVYDTFAGFFGVRARHLNEAHTPEIVGNASVALVESQFSPFTSLAFCLLSGLGLIGLQGTQKENITYGDRLLLQHTGAALMWSAIRYANPSTFDEIKEDALVFGGALAKMDTKTLWEVLFGRRGAQSFATATATAGDGTATATTGGGTTATTGGYVYQQPTTTTPTSGGYTSGGYVAPTYAPAPSGWVAPSYSPYGGGAYGQGTQYVPGAVGGFGSYSRPGGGLGVAGISVPVPAGISGDIAGVSPVAASPFLSPLAGGVAADVYGLGFAPPGVRMEELRARQEEYVKRILGSARFRKGGRPLPLEYPAQFQPFRRPPGQRGGLIEEQDPRFRYKHGVMAANPLRHGESSMQRVLSNVPPDDVSLRRLIEQQYRATFRQAPRYSSGPRGDNSFYYRG